MVKAPRAGQVKTRLAPVLSDDKAASLAACFAQDVLAKARRVVSEVMLAYAPTDGRAMLSSLLSGPLIWLEQEGTGLGERLEAVAERAHALAYCPLLIMGTDSPTLPVSCIRIACEALEASRADIALGPTEDGGYYLVGLSRPAPGLFQHIDWSTPRAYAQTARNAARLGLRLLRLPRWYDVDTPPDLSRLCRELLTSAEARESAPLTYRWLLDHTQGSAMRLCRNDER